MIFALFHSMWNLLRGDKPAAEERISFGENETNEFKRQSIEYAKAWSLKGMVCDFFEMKEASLYCFFFNNL